jgi:hypothetical protein
MENPEVGVRDAKAQGVLVYIPHSYINNTIPIFER